jgi:hypothetical protein
MVETPKGGAMKVRVIAVFVALTALAAALAPAVAGRWG